MCITLWVPPDTYANRRWETQLEHRTQPCAKTHRCDNDDLRVDKLWKGWRFRVDREVDLACIQETRWRGTGYRFYGEKGKRYELFWVGGRDRSDGVGIIVAEKRVDSVVSIKRPGERVLILNMVLDNGF